MKLFCNMISEIYVLLFPLRIIREAQSDHERGMCNKERERVRSLAHDRQDDARKRMREWREAEKARATGGARRLLSVRGTGAMRGSGVGWGRGEWAGG